MPNIEHATPENYFDAYRNGDGVCRIVDTVNKLVDAVNEGGGGGGDVPPELIARVAALETGLETAQDDILDNTTDITTLSGTVETLSGTVETLGGNVETLEGTVTTVGGDLETVEGTVTEQGTALESLNTTVSGHTTTITALADTKEEKCVITLQDTGDSYILQTSETDAGEEGYLTFVLESGD